MKSVLVPLLTRSLLLETKRTPAVLDVPNVCGNAKAQPGVIQHEDNTHNKDEQRNFIVVLNLCLISAQSWLKK